MANSGRTSRMISRLPAAGAIVIVPTKHVGDSVSLMILEQRGPDLDKRCDMVVIRYRDDLTLLQGAKKWIAIDHTFVEMSTREFADEVRAYVRESNAGLEHAEKGGERAELNR